MPRTSWLSPKSKSLLWRKKLEEVQNAKDQVKKAKEEVEKARDEAE